MKKGIVVVNVLTVAAVILAFATALADPIPPPEPSPTTPGASAETTVFTEIGATFDDVNLTPGADILDQVLPRTFSIVPGSLFTGGIVLELAGLASSNVMGIYDPTAPSTQVVIFVGADTTSRNKAFSFDPVDGSVIITDLDSPGSVDTGIIFGGATFGLFISSTSGTFFSEDSLNSDLLRHALIFHTESGGTGATGGHPIPAHQFLFAFEDIAGTGADRDFNDFIYHFELATTTKAPLPATLLLLGAGLTTVAFWRRRP